jgi:hypothetical protein
MLLRTAILFRSTRHVTRGKKTGNPANQRGPGWGGSYFPKDTRALAATAQQYGLSIRLMDAAVEANARQKKRWSEKSITMSAWATATPTWGSSPYPSYEWRSNCCYRPDTVGQRIAG